MCDNTAENPLVVDDPTLHVVVEEGASCFIEDSVIHSLRATNPVDVSFLGSTLLHGAAHNIMVTGNEGRVTVRGSIACNNLTASRNLPYAGDAADHRNPGTIRLIDVLAARHVFTEANAGREVLLRNTQEFVMRPTGCRRMLR